MILLDTSDGLTAQFEAFVFQLIAGCIAPFDTEAAERTAGASELRRAAGLRIEFNDAQIAA